jgi:hypothetical protein
MIDDSIASIQQPVAIIDLLANLRAVTRRPHLAHHRMAGRLSERPRDATLCLKQACHGGGYKNHLFIDTPQTISKSADIADSIFAEIGRVFYTLRHGC